MIVSWVVVLFNSVACDAIVHSLLVSFGGDYCVMVIGVANVVCFVWIVV